MIIECKLVQVKSRLAALLASALLTVSCAATASADDHEIFRAAQFDDVASVRTLLAQGVDPNRIDAARGETPMIMALHEGSTKVALYLLQQPGVDLEAKAANGSTALMMASFMHNREVVEALLARGARVNRPGFAAMHFAAAAGDEAILRILLAHHAEIDALSPNDMTPLMIAAREGQQGAVKLLLAAGADARLRTGDGKTAAEVALERDKGYIARDIDAFLKQHPAP